LNGLLKAFELHASDSELKSESMALKIE